MKLQAPFPYFGGKSTIAHLVWQALGDCDHYIEPFFGSGAVLLARPGWNLPYRTETVNDADGFVANVWRSLQFSPDEVARWCDWPVNHADLMARKAELLRNEERLLESLVSDPQWHDPVIAGYWIWAASCWIGSGLTQPGAIPHIGDKGMGVHAKGKRPHISDKGMGVHAKSKRPHISDKGMGVQEPYNTNLYYWFRRLSERLRNVRVVCGDWSRVCGGNWQAAQWNNAGIFFDPPYGVENRDKVYDVDSYQVASDVRAWCIERGSKKSYRIVLAGYKGEHEELIQHGWYSQSWTAPGGYSNTRRQETSQGVENRKLEVLWFSPYCRRRMLGLGQFLEEGQKRRRKSREVGS